jgi:hypothetical protein
MLINIVNNLDVGFPERVLVEVQAANAGFG